MMAGRGLVVLILALALPLPVANIALAQGQEEQPEPEESKKQTEKEKNRAEMDQALTDLEQGHTETVTVTATRVETELMKTPVAVTVIDQETLEREGVHNVTDLAQMVPNMDIATKNGQSTPMISLRGIRSTNETELGDPSVGVHLDGVYSPRMQGILGLMFDNERVEVLRGPQGTLFGRNSTVGSINIVSAKPKLDKFELRTFLQYGNYNAPELQVMVNKPVSETFAVRFAGRYHQRDSYVDGYWDPNQFDPRFVSGQVAGAGVIATGPEECTSPECAALTQKFPSAWWADDLGIPIRELVPADDDDFYMNAKEWAYRASGLWQPKHTNVSWNFSFQHFRSDGAGGIDLVNCDKLRGRPEYLLEEGTNEVVLDGNGDPIVTGTRDCSDMFPKDDTYQAVVNLPGEFYLDIMYLRSRFTWDIKDNLRFIHLIGLEDQDRESAQDMEQSLNAWDQAMFFLPGTGSNSWMNEFQLQSYGNERFNWIAGLNYFYEKTETIGYFDNPLDEKTLWDQPDRSTTAGALFAQGTYSFSDQWHLTIGSRYSDETKEDKGGRSYICNIANGCAQEEVGTEFVNNSQCPLGPPCPLPQTGFSREGLSGVSANFFEDPSIYPDSSINDNKGSWSHTDWRVSLDYQRNDGMLLYGYLATGFKAGGIGDVVTGSVQDGDFDENGNPIVVFFDPNVVIRTAYEPEEVTTLELGLKKRFLNGRLDLRAAYFVSDYENMQYASVGSLGWTEKYQQLLDLNNQPIDANEDGIPDFGWVGEPMFIGYFTQNVPGAEIQGLELEYDTRPWTGGRIHGYASWLDTEISEDWITKWDYDPVSYFGINFGDAADASNERLRVNLKGNELAVSPAVKLHMTVDHAFLLERQKATIVPWVTAHWEDDSYLTIWNVDKHTDDLDFVIRDEDIRYTDDRREAWTMVHAGVALHTGAWKAELYGYNLTDELVQWWGGAAEQVTKGSMSMPRTYGIRIGYAF